MRGKCATCEFWYDIERIVHSVYVQGEEKLQDIRVGECRIRSVAEFPERLEIKWCGEHMPQSIQCDPPEDLPEVHTGTRVEKSMGEDDG